ncbi:hypothetical protein JCM5296_006571 [Sporobolomyces johnsonii]
MDSEQDSSSTGAEEPKLNLNTIKVRGNGSCHSKLLVITSRDRSYIRVLVGSANQSLNGQGRQRTPDSRTTGNISVEQGGLFDFPVDSIDLHQFAATYEKLEDEATLQGDLVPHDLDTTFAVLPGSTLSDDIPEALKKRRRYDFVEGRFRPKENLVIRRLVEAGVKLKEIARQLNSKKTSIYNHMLYLYPPEELRNMAASRAPPKKKRKTAKSGTTSLDASRESAEAGPSNLAEESDRGVSSSGGLETL